MMDDSDIRSYGEFSNANGESSISSTDYKSVIGDVITEKMASEEARLEAKAIKEEKVLKEKAIKEQILKEEREQLEEQCYKRLNLLLSRSSIYAQFMADKLKRDNIKEAKKMSRLEKRKDQFEAQNSDPNNVSSKRKTDVKNNSPKKRLRSEMTVVDIFKKEGPKYEPKSDENDISNSIENPADKQPKLLSGAVMHPYQIEGYEWLKVLCENGVNGILADEMGLGKTIQSIALIAFLIEMGVTGPFFVCGPLSTVPNWFAEIKRFAPTLPAIVYHGVKEERIELRKKILKKVKTENTSCYPIVITSYQIALNDAKFLSRYDWKLLVIDEAHRIKNFECKLVSALKCFNASHRLLLTGTPLQNNLAELWSLLNFILPEIFDDLKVFESWFDISRLTQKGGTDDIVAKEQEKQIVSTIHQILTPFLLRRTKAEVQLKLPEKKEVIVHAPLTMLQQEYYSAALNKTIEDVCGSSRGKHFNIEFDIDSSRPKRNVQNNFAEIYKMLEDSFDFNDGAPSEAFNDTLCELSGLPLSSESSKDTKSNISNISVPSVISKNITGLNQEPAPSVISKSKNGELFADIKINTRNLSMLLRKICGHPYLISYPFDDSGGFKIDEDLVRSSGKLLLLDQLLPELKRRGHKILLFSQFVTMLEIIQDYCIYRKFKYNLLQGSMNLAERELEIREFNESPDSFMFLISTKAGGLGINLAHADTVIIYDSDWNPQGDLQAQDRCHRIGQTKPVVVYRFIVPNSVDETILNRASAKRKLERVIIKKGRFSSKSNDKVTGKLSLEELMELLKQNDFNRFVKTDDNNVLSQSELEKILDRSDLKLM